MTTTPVIQNTMINLADLAPHPSNYRTHPESQIQDLMASLLRFGQVKSIVIQEGPHPLCVAGHGIVEAARRLNYSELRADVIPADWSPADVKGYLIADNQHAANAIDDEAILASLLQEQHDMGLGLASLGTDEEALRQLLAKLEDEEAGLNDAIERPTGKPNPRKLAFDMIFTWNRADGLCCLAAQAGLRYGIQSFGASSGPNGGICPLSQGDLWTGRHRLTFVDNDYFHYDHAFHLASVGTYRPKYATVRDVMTKHQCAVAGIDWFSLEQVLAWADELSEYAENVIVIPKYDCLDKIPDRFMLGYSVPSSHGGTPLPIEAFRGRRVHLLGGSWKAQLSYMAELGDDVVSADNNQIALLATKFGTFTLPDGETRSLTEAGFESIALSNPRYVAFALSVGAIAMKVNELYPLAVLQEPQEEEEVWTR